MRVVRWGVLTCLMLGWAAPGAAQPAEPSSGPVLELTAGHAGFLDEAPIGHGVIGAGVRFSLSPRVSIGPEVQYMVGPGHDRDLVVTGNVFVDLRSGGRVVPYVVAGGGGFQHTDRFGGSSFSSWEGAFTGGGGIRAWLTPRISVASEFRVGWEPHYRISGTLGIVLPR